MRRPKLTDNALHFCRVWKDTHAAGGTSDDVARKMNLTRTRVTGYAAWLRMRGVRLPYFKSGPRPKTFKA